MNLLDKIKQNPEEISFDEVIAYIDEHYDFVPTAFQNGEIFNEENQNNGSCKIFSFAKKLGLNEKNTLFLFGDFYRKDVLGDWILGKYFGVASIKEVAVAAGVSVSTVSRALNGYTDVREDTRKKIMDIAQELGYRPSQSARNLSSKRKENVAILISGLGSNSPVDEFTGNVLKGLNSYIQGKNMIIAMYGISSKMQANQKLSEFCREYSLSGVILAGLKLGDPYIEEIKHTDIPCVGIDIKLEGKMGASILTNDIEAFREITNYAIEKGFSQLVLVKGKNEASVTHERYAGFKEALKDKGISQKEVDVLDCRFDENLAYKKVKSYIEKHKKNKGRTFVCMSDLMAVAAAKAIEDLGYSVSKDFIVTGFDGIQLLNYIRPRIATIDQNIVKKGYEGMRLLMKIIKGEDIPRTIYVKHRLIEGE